MTPSLCSTRLFLAFCLLLLAPGVQCFVPPSPSTPPKRQQSQLHVVSVETLETVEVLQAAVVPTAAAVAVPAATTVLARMDAFWHTSPYTAAALVCGFKASAADAIAQHQVDLEELDLDLKRNLAFVLYGALYQGMVHEYVFNHLYPAWFGTGTELGVVLVKVVFNLFVQTTFVTLPVAYLLKAVVMEEDGGYFEVALDKYWQDIRHQQLLTKCFGLWGPVQCITFSVVPEHYRVTFIAVVSFFWLIILSQISNAENDIEGVEE